MRGMSRCHVFWFLFFFFFLKKEKETQIPVNELVKKKFSEIYMYVVSPSTLRLTIWMFESVIGAKKYLSAKQI